MKALLDTHAFVWYLLGDRIAPYTAILSPSAPSAPSASPASSTCPHQKLLTTSCLPPLPTAPHSSKLDLGVYWQF